MTDERRDDERAPDRRKFLTGAGVAGLAAGAAVLGTASPAAATAPSTIVDHDLTEAIRWIDFNDSPPIKDVDLGDGFAKATFSAYGDMATLTLRVKVGSGGNTGQGPWAIQAADMPSGYEPAEPPNDMTDVGTSAWQGLGTVLDLTNANQSQYGFGTSWSNFSTYGLGTLMVWAFFDRHNDGSGAVMFNYGGTVPYGTALAPGALFYSTLTYLRADAVA